MALFRHIAAGTFPGEIWTFGIHSDGTLSPGDAADLWETNSRAFWSGIEDHICTDVEFTRATTIQLDESDGSQITRRDREFTDPGTSADACLPFQVTAVVSLRTELATRRGRGRFYVPAMAVTAQDAGRLTTTVQGDLADAAQTMIQGLASGGLVTVVLSRDTMNSEEVQTIDVGDVIDTQRRRRNALTEVRESRTI